MRGRDSLCSSSTPAASARRTSGGGLADRAIPLQGIYCAAKHAVKAFTDTMRMELESYGIPISVSLVKPASMDTPFFDKAKTFMGVSNHSRFPRCTRRRLRRT